MENRGNWPSEELASAKAEFRGYRSSGRAPRPSSEDPVVNTPEIEINFDSGIDSFRPGDFLICEYFVRGAERCHINAIETSVVWLTVGKGEEDIGVHFFERRQQRSLTSETFKHEQRLSTVLPASPLTYRGEILKIYWCVRVRLYLDDGQQVTEDKGFRLGDVQPFGNSTSELAEDDADENKTKS